MSTTEIILTITVLTGLGNLLSRGFPFLFSKILKEHKNIQFVGMYLPAAIMSILVLYCLKDISPFEKPFALPELVGIAMTILIHFWKRHIFLSIFSGTLSYFLLRNFIAYVLGQ